MKKSIKIQDLKVKSFVTSMEKNESGTVKGGVRTKAYLLCSAMCNNFSQGARVCSHDSC